MRGLCAVFVIGLALALIGGPTFAQDSDAKPIELSKAERAEIENFLGEGVVGKAVAGDPIADTAKFFPFEPGSWTFRFTSGENKGKTQEQSFKTMKKDESGATGRYQNGKDQVDFLIRSKDGGISVVSEQDAKQGVISRFSPPEPIYVGGLKPGDSKKFKVDVKVYDLSDPKDVTHSGSLDLTYSGKVGPASVEDTQYRFLAQGVGVVAMIEKKDISAVLIYHDHSKYGKVLMKSN
jgi:hypothetical protein